MHPASVCTPDKIRSPVFYPNLTAFFRFSRLITIHSNCGVFIALTRDAQRKFAEVTASVTIQGFAAQPVFVGAASHLFYFPLFGVYR
jgi:hypothetical protein